MDASRRYSHPMGIQTIPPPDHAVPKALCPKCHRPIAMVRTGKCAYCGEVVPGLSKARALGAPDPTPPDFLGVDIEGMIPKGGRSRLVWQIMGFVSMALLAGGMMGTCMKH